MCIAVQNYIVGTRHFRIGYGWICIWKHSKLIKLITVHFKVKFYHSTTYYVVVHVCRLVVKLIFLEVWQYMSAFPLFATSQEVKFHLSTNHSIWIAPLGKKISIETCRFGNVNHLSEFANLSNLILPQSTKLKSSKLSFR